MTLLSTASLPPIQWFALLKRSGSATVEHWESYHKQTYRNRCVIATANGQEILTIPVEKPEDGSRLIKDMMISDHDDWRTKHWHSLESAYFNTPFFEFYQDDLRPFYERRWKFLVDFNEAIVNKCMELMGLDAELLHTGSFIDEDQAKKSGVDDHRYDISPKIPLTDDIYVAKPYYQVFAQKHGFLPGLSIIDLILNMGPESIFYL